MASVDPNAITPLEVAGIQFQVREIKLAGRRDITQTLEQFAKSASVSEMFDKLVACAMRYAIGWNQTESLTVAAFEERMDVMDIIELLKVILYNGMLSVDDKKKSELQLSSNEASYVQPVSVANAEIGKKSPSNVQSAAGLDVAIATTATLPLNARESFAAPSLMKSI